MNRRRPGAGSRIGGAPVLGLVLAAIFFPVLDGAAQNLRRAPGPAERAYAAKIGWPEAADKIGAALRAGYQPGHGGVAGSSGNAAFQSWLLLYRWSELLSRKEADELTRFFGGFFVTDLDPARRGRPLFVPPGYAVPPGNPPLPAATLAALVGDAETRREAGARLLPPGFTPGAGTVANAFPAEFLAALAGNEAFLRAFFATVSDRDFVPAALRALQEIHADNPEKFFEYQNLAIALALVRDQRAPAWWPHPQVDAKNVPAGQVPTVEQFRFWVASNEGQRLYTDLRKLSPEELKFVVDAPIALSELQWAQKNARFPRGDFGRAFSSIRYRHDRIDSQTFVWNDGPYTLEAIREHGGICVDQAYFAMLSGKARGLPTLYFTGQGADGGHAWFGYLKGENRWDMDCGRYENQNYAVGEALDPQTWRPINDHELASLAESFRRTPGYLASQADLTMAEIFERAGDNAQALAALDGAIAVSPRNDLAWTAKGAFLLRSGASTEARQAYHQAAIKQFANNDDLKVFHQRALAGIVRGSGDEKAAGALEGQIISQNRRARSDLSVSAASDRLEGLVKAKKFDDAMKEYRNLLSRLGRKGGGAFFYEIVRPFAQSLAAGGNPTAAKRVIEMARGTLRPESGSILDQDLASLAETLANSAGGNR